jgi:hypothetical protein
MGSVTTTILPALVRQQRGRASGCSAQHGGMTDGWGIDRAPRAAPVDRGPGARRDVRMADHFTVTHPSTPFARQVVAIRKAECERRTLDGRELTVGRPDGSEEKRTLSADEVVEALVEDFRIVLGDEERRELRSR